jgi:hypothetical protein
MTRRDLGLADWIPSRLFIYYGERVIEGTVGTDAGAEIRDGIKVVASLGAPPESLCPYDISKFTRKPSALAFGEAAKHLVTSYERVPQTVDQIRACLAGGDPVVFGFSVYESFESDAVAQTGVVPMPKKTENLLGGHCVVLVGYQHAKKRFIVRNSWGPSWGDGGCCYMPYAYVCNPAMADDFWCVRLVA